MLARYRFRQVGLLKCNLYFNWPLSKNWFFFPGLINPTKLMINRHHSSRSTAFALLRQSNIIGLHERFGEFDYRTESTQSKRIKLKRFDFVRIKGHKYR